MENGLDDDEDIRDLVVQICYRAADLGFFLDREGSRLSSYSKNLRAEPDVNYHDLDNPYDDWEMQSDQQEE